MVKLLYIILLVAAALFYPLYTDKLSFITLVTLMILPVVTLCQLIISSMFLKCRLLKDDLTVYKGGEGEICIRFFNNSVFPLSGCRIKVKAVFRPSGEVRYYTASIPIPALKAETASISIEGLHCGAADIYLEYVKIYDLLRLFSVKKFKRDKLSGSVYIIPKIEERFFEEAHKLLELPPEESVTESETVIKNGSGVPGDVSGFREFAPGDRLSMIHYKLSARFDSDIVKEMPPAAGNRYLLTADLSEAQSPDERDELLCKLMSCAHYLHENKAEVYTSVPDGSECRTERLRGGEAAVYYDDTAYFPIARALAESYFPGMPPENGYIYCNMQTDMPSEELSA